MRRWLHFFRNNVLRILILLLDSLRLGTREFRVKIHERRDSILRRLIRGIGSTEIAVRASTVL